MAVAKLANRFVVVLVHIAGWAAFLIFPFFNTPRLIQGGHVIHFRSGDGMSAPFPPPSPPPGSMNIDMGSLNNFRIPALIFNVMVMIFFYINIYFLIPQILIKRGWKIYALTVVTGFLIIYALQGLVPELLDIGWHHQPLSFLIFSFLTAFALSTSLRLTSDRMKFEQQHNERENENLKSELSFLRSQVSPHFMFNVLNSLASLARKKSDQLESAIIQLSQLLRYMLYESGDAKVTLEKEAEYLKSYVDLQKLRFGLDVAVRYNAEIVNRETVIEPMLLIPFVENSFKHGIGMVREPMIEIKFQATDRELNFTVKNKFSKNPDQSKDPSSGIGLVNVKRRLDLLYKDHYTLVTSSIDDWFTVELKLVLS